MPIDIQRDDAGRRLTAIGRGEFRADDFIGVLVTMRDADAWTYAVLVDLRQMTGEPVIADLKPLMALAESMNENDVSRGPVAIVAINQVIYGIACAYAAAAKPQGRIAVFRDREEAEHWLGDYRSQRA
jgi:hypothetical protein